MHPNMTRGDQYDGELFVGQAVHCAITADAPAIKRIYDAACQQWGRERVDADHTRIWDPRCIWGMKGILPFGGLVSMNLSEVLWVAESVCGLVQTPRPVKASRPPRARSARFQPQENMNGKVQCSIPH